MTILHALEVAVIETEAKAVRLRIRAEDARLRGAALLPPALVRAADEATEAADTIRVYLNEIDPLNPR